MFQSRFLFSTVLSLYNKWMFSPAYFGFPYPLFVTSLHMFVQFILAAAIRSIWPQHFRPEHSPTRADYGCVFPTERIILTAFCYVNWAPLASGKGVLMRLVAKQTFSASFLSFEFYSALSLLLRRLWIYMRHFQHCALEIYISFPLLLY